MGTITGFLLLCSVHLAASVQLPHILFVLADDYGWNDIGYHQNKKSSANPDALHTTKDIILTPVLDNLASEGMKLENYYVQPLCSPTRGTILTGRYPSHTGIGPNVIKPTHPYAMPKREVMLPAVLKKSGYKTHMVGKWHQGYCDVRYTPTYRGFDTYTGYLNGAEDYFEHTRADSGFSGLDFRNSTKIKDLGAPVKDLSCNETTCYSTHVFTHEVERIIKNHNPAEPLFIYLPYQAVHGPLQAPASYILPYENKFGGNKDRIMDAAMVSAMDEGIGNITRAMKKAGLWNDTLLVFSTDNGGPIPHSNNYPLRGHKSTNWEGGVRGVSFIRGTDSDLAPIPAGTTSMELMHSTDWLPTLASLAGIDPEQDAGTLELDGVNQWAVFNKNATTTRTSIMHNVPAEGYGGAIRVGQYKLLFEGYQTAGNMPQTAPPGFIPAHNGTIPKTFSLRINGTAVNTWLFDVLADPTENTNLAPLRSTLLQEMLGHYEAYQKTAVPDLADTHAKTDPAANPALRKDATWGPFPNSNLCKYL